MESGILCASGPELSILATTVAIYIGELFATEDLNTIANFLNILGDTVALLATQKSRCEDSVNKIINSINNVISNSSITKQNV